MMTKTITTTSVSDRSSPATVKISSPAAVWWRAYRHHLRILRSGALAWIVALTFISTGVVVTFEDRVGTEAERAALAAMEGIPAFEALSGRYVQIVTVEGFVLSRWGMFAILVAVWGMLAAVRLMRGAEEAGHVEPLRAGVITPRGLLSAALAALFTFYAIFAVAIGVTHSAVGMDTATSWALGGAVALLAATFAAAGALASQLAGSRRRAVGLVGAFLGVALGVRLLAAATATPDWVWWATPFGWIGFLHEVDGARMAVFAAFAALLAVLVGAALTFARRDVHAGLVGGAEATVERARPVRSQLGLVLRLTAGPAATWGAMIAILALAFGLLARDFVEAMAEMPTMVELSGQLFGVVLGTPEGMVAMSFFFGALLLAVFAAGQAAEIRDEEASWRLEHLLVRPLGRTRWLVTRVLVSAAAVVAIAVVGGVAARSRRPPSGSPSATRRCPRPPSPPPTSSSCRWDSWAGCWGHPSSCPTGRRRSAGRHRCARGSRRAFAPPPAEASRPGCGSCSSAGRWCCAPSPPGLTGATRSAATREAVGAPRRQHEPRKGPASKAHELEPGAPRPTFARISRYLAVARLEG
jgi:ABC-2 type transport system permease protein